MGKTNSHLHQMQATKTISPRRQESRNSAAPNERQQDIQQPKTLVFGDKPASSFFFPPVWPIRTRHGPYNSVSGEKHLEKGLVWSKNVGKSSHRHKQKTKQNTQPKRPANPPARFAFRQKANSEATKNGAGPKQEPNLKTSFVTTKPAEIAHVLVHASCMHLVSAQTVCSSLE